jgi:hypothetical protein
MADWWLQSGTTSTEADANSPRMGGTRGSITSEQASANLVRRSVSVTVGSTSGAAFASTQMALWTAPVPVTVTSIKVTPLTAWTVATSGPVFDIWSCAAGAQVAYNASTTSVMKTVGDVNSCFTLLSSAVTLAACETLRLKVSLPGTTSCAQVAHFQIDYVTSG